MCEGYRFDSVFKPETSDQPDRETYGRVVTIVISLYMCKIYRIKMKNVKKKEHSMDKS
jgi:hypothetical protein